MNWIWIGAALCVVGFLVLLWWYRDSYGGEAAFTVWVVAVLLIGLSGVFASCAAWDFAPAMRSAGQVRHAVEALGCTGSEDVLGSAAEFNATVESNKLWNTRWLADPFIPDGWDTVSVIDIPLCSAESVPRGRIER